MSPLLFLQTPSNAGFHPANSRPLWIVNPMTLHISYFISSFLIHGSIFIIQNVDVPYTYHAVILFWLDGHELYFLIISTLILFLFVFTVPSVKIYPHQRGVWFLPSAPEKWSLGPWNVLPDKSVSVFLGSLTTEHSNNVIYDGGFGPAISVPTSGSSQELETLWISLISGGARN